MIEGISLVGFCPFCRIPLLSIEEMRLVVEFLPISEKTQKFFKKKNVATIGFFYPETEELKLLLNNRFYLFPICLECAEKPSTPELWLKAEENLVLSRRFGRLTTIQVEG